jgi:hypothetical protein
MTCEKVYKIIDCSKYEESLHFELDHLKYALSYDFIRKKMQDVGVEFDTKRDAALIHLDNIPSNRDPLTRTYNMKCNEGFQPLISIERNNKHVRKEEFVLSVVVREAQDFAKEIAMKHLKSSALKDVLSTPGSVEKKQYMSCSSNSTADSHGLGSNSRSDKRKKNLCFHISTTSSRLSIK